MAEYQLNRFNQLMSTILPDNTFYRRHLREFEFPLRSLDDISSLPYTLKDHLINESGSSDFASNLTYPLEDYCRFHRTSGTRGRPMTVLDYGIRLELVDRNLAVRTGRGPDYAP